MAIPYGCWIALSLHLHGVLDYFMVLYLDNSTFIVFGDFSIFLKTNVKCLLLI